MNTQVFIVTGLPGTGKSTLAQAIAREFDAGYLNTDRIRTEIGLRGQYGRAAKEAIYVLLLQEADSFLAKNKSIVLDGTFYLEKHREAFDKLARKWHIDPIWIELKADEVVIRGRMSKKREFSEANYGVYEEIKEIWEPINGEHIVLWSDRMSTGEMINHISSALMEQV